MQHAYRTRIGRWIARLLKDRRRARLLAEIRREFHRRRLLPLNEKHFNCRCDIDAGRTMRRS